MRKIFNLYTVEGLSIGAITRLLTELGVPTRKQKPRWERSVIWAILRNPACHKKVNPQFMAYFQAITPHESLFFKNLKKLEFSAAFIFSKQAIPG